MYQILFFSTSKIYSQTWKSDIFSNDFNIAFYQEFDGNLDVDRLEEALKRFISDNILLDSHLKTIEEDLYWVQNQNIYELNHFEQLENKDILTYVQRPFNLETEQPLYRFGLIKYRDNKYKLIAVLHHAIISHISFVNSLAKELSNYYNDENYKNSCSLEEQVSKISKLSDNLSESMKLIQEENKLFWEERLAGIETVDLRFLTLKNKEIEESYQEKQKEESSLTVIKNIGKIEFSFDKDIADKLETIENKYKISPHLYGQSIYAMLLHKYTGQTKFCISHAEIHGYLYESPINNNIIIYDFKNISNILDLIEQIKDFSFWVKENGANINYLLAVLGETSYKDLIKVSFNIKANIDDTYKFIGLESNLSKKIDINFNNYLSFEQKLSKESQKINYQVRYNINKVNLYLLEQFIECYKRLFVQTLEELIVIKSKNELIEIKDYVLISDEQYQQTIYDWNDTYKEYPLDKTIHEVFEEQVDKFPDNLAIICEEARLTYKELNEQANRLASYIKSKHDIQPEALIALCLDRNHHMIIAILAVLKVGAAYVPIEPRYPAERIKYIINDTGSRVVLTNEIYKNRLEEDISNDLELLIIGIDSNKFKEQLLLQPVANLNIPDITNSNLAYIIYTSGTTGNPKGVLIEHKGVLNLKYDLPISYGLGINEVVLLCSNYVFDASVEDISLSLLNGGTLVIPAHLLWESSESFCQYLNTHKVTHIGATPTFVGQYDLGEANTVRRITLSGESLTEVFYNKIKHNNFKIINCYGPTETTIISVINLIKDDNLAVGRPLANIKVYILDENYNPLPIGAIGEIYIGSVGMGRGYLNLPDLTAEKFIINPFKIKEDNIDRKYNFNNSLIYKTGDLGRWLPSGELDYIGRNDFQIKLRGYRVELGEIESVLSNYKGIKQSVVLAIDHTDDVGTPTGQKYLVAYYLMDVVIEENDNQDFTKMWEKIYQTDYESLDINNYKNNVNVWVSSYTNEAIPLNDMAEWVNETVKRIKDLNPKVILEIGSGSGLILFNIIDNCDYYYATDISQNAIDYTNKVIQKFNYQKKVLPFCCGANEIPYNEIKRSYDTVVINSVVLHFPSIEYLESIINEIISNMKNSGQIFIGDTYDYRLQKCFHSSVQHHKKGKIGKAEVEYSLIKDKYLWVSPEYFMSLKNTHKNISNVEVMPKIGEADTEMNKYRYDIILHINKGEKKNSKDIIYVKESDLIEVMDFDGGLNSAQEYIFVKYPNKRIIEDYETYSLVYGITSTINKNAYKNILSVNEIIKSAESKNNNIKLYLNLSDPLYINILLYKGDDISIEFDYSQKNHLLKSDLSNKLLINYKLTENEISRELEEYLQGQLPEYMIPSSYMLLEKLPLTITGKLDRKALPIPVLNKQRTYEAPRNDIESKICKVWSEVLGLPVDKVGICDDFFRLGGNSISAIKLAGKINNELGNVINVTDIFKYKTIKKLSEHLKNNDNERTLISKTYISNPEDQVLSFGQERLWFIEQYDKGTKVYNTTKVFKISEITKIDLLEKSIKSLVSRHKILRTLIKQDNKGNFYQVVINEQEQPFELSTIIIKDRLHFDQELEKEANHIYDLSSEYPIRVKIFKVNGDKISNPEYYISIIIHHIAFDGWSNDIFFKELKEYYRYYLQKDDGIEAVLHLPKLDMEYQDYAIWQKHNYLNTEKFQEQLNYWKKKIEGYEALNLIPDMPRPKEMDYKGKNINFVLDEETSLNLRKLAKKLGVSLYSVFLAGYYLFLRIYSNQNDIVIGTVIANRHHKQLENVMGFFVNTLVLRQQIDNNKLIKTFIQEVGEEIIEAQLNQDLPFDKLVEAIEKNRDTSKNPIFQVMFDFQSFAKDTDEKKLLELDGLLQKYKTEEDFNMAQFDVSTSLDDSDTCIRGIFNYATSLYDEKTIKRFILTYEKILTQFAFLEKDKRKIEHLKIGEINYLNDLDYQLIKDWNNTYKSYLDSKTIHEAFEEQVNKNPDNLAIICEEARLTYKDLNEQANRLARYLKNKYDVQQEELITLCLDRNHHMIIAILAVLKLGAAYVPIEPSYPAERIKYIINDTKTRFILINQIHKIRLEEDIAIGNSDLAIIGIDNYDFKEQLLLQSTDNLNVSDITDSNLAYIIYTSGTTGTPKGVMIEHKGVLNLKYDLPIRYGLGSNEVVLLCSNYVFDSSVEDISLSLLNGGTLVIPAHLLWESSESFCQYLNTHKVTHIGATPTFLGQYDLGEALTLRRISVGGEKVTEQFYNKVKQVSNLKIINGYGPTETTIDSIVNNHTQYDDLSIGRPIANTQCHVLDVNMTPVPIGAVGELYIGGDGVARGYLNKSDLTNEKFVPNPFHSQKERGNSKLYKTGDLVKWKPNGNLEYIGRNDSQIKLRGYRIELREIESILSRYSGIKHCVVVIKENLNNTESITDNKYLIGYYVADNKLNEEEILKHLQHKLPEYMIPSMLVYLDKLPMTINGKLDSKALPSVQFGDDIVAQVTSRNELEAKVTQIWEEVLEIPVNKIGIQDDFFRLGGNSIRAVKLISNLNKYYQSHLKVVDIYLYRTIEMLLPKIIQTKNSYQTVVKLNNTCSNKNMFMIHPGMGGCEVYASIASKLEGNFSCYGIDSYNLYNKNKIDNLNELATYYLSYIEKIMSETQQTEYYLFGWSLGGQIGLEIAAILEQKNVTNITIYLLDTIIEDSYLSNLENQTSELETANKFIAQLSAEGHDKLYIEKIMSVLESENSLMEQEISSPLVYTKLILFKAMLEDKRFQYDNSREAHEYLLKLEYNNIDKILKNKSGIEVVKVSDAHHWNILNQEALLLEHLLKGKFYKKSL